MLGNFHAEYKLVNYLRQKILQRRSLSVTHFYRTSYIKAFTITFAQSISNYFTISFRLSTRRWNSSINFRGWTSVSSRLFTSSSFNHHFSFSMNHAANVNKQKCLKIVKPFYNEQNYIANEIILHSNMNSPRLPSSTVMTENLTQ